MKIMTTAMGILVSFMITPAVAAKNDQGSAIAGQQLQVLEARASTGNDKAQMKLAQMYLHGVGVKRDVEKAVAWYSLAAERGLAFAQHKLARLYLDGDIIEQDIEKALAWLERAADLGFIKAQLDLSLLFESAQYMPPDYVSAYKWLNIAASLSEIDIESRQNQLEMKMSFLEIAQAKYLYRACILRGYRDC